MTANRPSPDEGNERDPLPIPPRACATHRIIANQLSALNGMTTVACTSASFLRQWQEILRFFEQYQREIIEASTLRVTCRKSCAACCDHWVDEVYSFEAEIIAGHLQKHHAEKIPSIINRCREDAAVLNRLNCLVEQRLSSPIDDPTEPIDARDLLLSVFYQMRRPCPLLKNDGCIAYDVRPLTCRGYVSFFDARHCDPGHINDGPAAAYLFSLEDEAKALLEKLHEKHLKFEGEYGLRALLVKYLDT